jgi:hypothetical protein
MLDPTGHGAKNSKPQNGSGEGPLKMGFQNLLIPLTMFNKDMHTSK